MCDLYGSVLLLKDRVTELCDSLQSGTELVSNNSISLYLDPRLPPSSHHGKANSCCLSHRVRSDLPC